MEAFSPAELERMHEEILQRMELLDVLYAFAPQVQDPMELATALQITAATIQGLMGGECCAVVTLKDERPHLSGFAGNIPARLAQRLQAGEWPLAMAREAAEPQWIAPSGESPWLVVPMRVRGVHCGWILIGYPANTLAVSARLLELATGIARQAAIALENARMVLQIKDEQAALAEANVALKQREAELQRLNDRLAEATKLKSEFLARMSHDLRTPLNAIIGFSEALLAGIDGPLNEDQRESLSYVHKGGTELLLLINDLLDLSKIEAGRMTVQIEEFAARDLLASAVAGLRPLAEAKGLTLELVVSPDMPVLRTDPRRLRQIVINLVGNAIKFTAAGSVRVAARPEQDGLWELAVTDTGPGIPADQLERIFEEFAQLTGGGSAREAGTGLGLAICKRLAQLLGGDIRAESVIGAGSTFRLRLPLAWDGHTKTIGMSSGDV